MTDTAPPGPARSPQPRIEIRQISQDDVYAALSAGWADFRSQPQYGLFFGAVYALAGILLAFQLWVWDRPLWIVPFAFAFPLIGPFVAIGLYEVSRRREAGEPISWGAILGVMGRERDRQMPSMAFVMLAGVLVWMFAAALIVALVLGGEPGTAYFDPDVILASGRGIAMLILGGLVGATIAAVLFAITAFALPLLLDHDVDYVTAMVFSVRAVLANPYPMLNWAWVIAAILIVAMLPLFLGLLVALPVLGHATWHLYRKVIG